jgi:hypothetical protein
MKLSWLQVCWYGLQMIGVVFHIVLTTTQVQALVSFPGSIAWLLAFHYCNETPEIIYKKRKVYLVS